MRGNISGLPNPNDEKRGHMTNSFGDGSGYNCGFTRGDGGGYLCDLANANELGGLLITA